MWTLIDHKIEGMGSYQSKTMWHPDVIQGNAYPHYVCLVSPRYERFTEPLFLLENETCHPLMSTHVTHGPQRMSYSCSCPPAQRGWRHVWDSRSLHNFWEFERFGHSIIKGCSTSMVDHRTMIIDCWNTESLGHRLQIVERQTLKRGLSMQNVDQWRDKETWWDFETHPA